MIELYRFDHGDTTWRYTSADRDVIYDGSTYASVPIGRDAVERDHESGRILSISTPHDEESSPLPVMTLHILDNPSPPVRLEILRGDGEIFYSVFKGIVARPRLNKYEVALECVATLVDDSKPGPRERFSRVCRHALYSRGCGVDREDFKFTGTVSAITLDGLEIQSAAFASSEIAAGLLTGGTIEVNGQKRLVWGHIGSGWVTITEPIRGIDTGDAIVGFAGCNHTIPQCETRFDNRANFGGFISIPATNPYSRSINLSSGGS
jgi:hypothetical protein